MSSVKVVSLGLLRRRMAIAPGLTKESLLEPELWENELPRLPGW